MIRCSPEPADRPTGHARLIGGPCDVNIRAMAWRALGDRAWLFEAAAANDGTRNAMVLSMARRIKAAQIPGVRDAVPSFDTVAVHFEDPGQGKRVLMTLESLMPDAEPTEAGGREILRVPVAYGGDHGPDLDQAAAALDLAPEEIARIHFEAIYTVAAVGFSPGFPYLTGLPERLRLPRRATPRRVAAGSVAIAGAQAGIYPNDSHAGWHVIGRTSLELFEASRDDPALLKPGDRLRFTPGGVITGRRERFQAGQPLEHALEVLEPGMLTTVQDAGRPGYQHIGVSPGGAADPMMAGIANRLVGNPPDAAVIECCMQGPVLRVPRGARVAWVGWDDPASGRPHDPTDGGLVDLRGRMAAPHGYFAIAGGIDVPRVLGSRATDLRAGFGGWHGRCLKAGDRLPAGAPQGGPPPGAWRVGWPCEMTPTAVLELRYLPGLQSDWFTEQSVETFQRAFYQATSAFDRTGARLDGPPLALREAREMASQPVAAGSVQVPPDGRPIVLMSERQTIGGYPQIGHVISADLPRLARAWPGTNLRFREVTLDEARAAWCGLQRELALLETGILLRGSCQSQAIHPSHPRHPNHLSGAASGIPNPHPAAT